MTEVIVLVALLLAGIAWFHVALLEHACRVLGHDVSDLSRRVVELERAADPCRCHVVRRGDFK